MSHRRGAGGGMTDADFRKLQLDYYKNNPKSKALPFKDFLKEVKNEQEIMEAVSSDRHEVPRSNRHRAPALSKKEQAIREAVGSKRHKFPGSDRHLPSDLSKKEQAIREAVGSKRHKFPGSNRHRASDLLGHDHHSHGSRSARPLVSPRAGAYPKHNTPSARGMEDQYDMAGHGFENEPLLPRQRGDLRGTGTHDRDGVFEDRRPSGRFGGHHEPGRHARQAEGLHQHTMAEDFGGMRLGDLGHHGHRSEPHQFGSRNGPPGDTYDESQFTSRGSRRGVREPPKRDPLVDSMAEDLDGLRLGDQGHRGSRRGHNGGRSVRGADLEPLGCRPLTPVPLSSRHQTASSRLQHSRTQGERHHTPHGGFSQHPGFQGSQGGRGGREDDYW